MLCDHIVNIIVLRRFIDGCIRGNNAAAPYSIVGIVLVAAELNGPAFADSKLFDRNSTVVVNIKDNILPRLLVDDKALSDAAVGTQIASQ